MTRRGAQKPESHIGSLELHVEGGDYRALGASGVLAMIPVTTWVAMILIPLSVEHPPHGGSSSSPVADAALVVATLLAVLVAPWLVPILVLRARQPRGARIVWDDEGVTEWDGPSKRASIAWRGLRAGRVKWETKLMHRTVVDEGLQLVGPPPARIITLWTERPAGVPPVRRRLCADPARVEELRRELERRRIALDAPTEWLLACDPERPPHRGLTIAGRFGYPLATLAPLVVPTSHAVGAALTVAAALLLSARALPSLREARTLSAHVRESTRTERARSQAEPDDETPYRAALSVRGAPASSDDADGSALAATWRLRAARIESLVRVACVLLVLVSSAVAWSSLH